ncbi:hypothetical protein NM688_g9424 [Phlebia brevispora]|uniref:Uncharacterized protein n=1 Tax=Phlebia brevispora TaxID=194682 RepID=A0ACC1RHR3_9APHY|nr:hypothetical protein NM688_g9424 [Phlebia brevispora]
MTPSRASSHIGLASPGVQSPLLPTAANGDSLVTDNVIRTKVLLLGLRRVGKTSIQEVIFKDLPPKQTFYLETTTRVTQLPVDTVIPLEIWDCPSTITLETLDAPLNQFSSIIFVIDIQELYQPAIAKLVDFVIAAYQENPGIHLEVFVHKADTLSEEYKTDNFRHIQQRVLDELYDISVEYEQIPINFHLTSIYDHSLHEAFSKVLHKLIDSLPFLEDLLNVFCANSQASKAFLFDSASRLYVATDASPVDQPTHGLCSDYLHMLNSFGPLYRSISASPLRQHELPLDIPTSPVQLEYSLSTGTHTPNTPFASGSPHLPSSPSLLPQHISIPPSPASPPQASQSNTPTKPKLKKGLFYPSASASLSPTSTGAGTTLTYRLITPQLALLALLPTTVFDTRRGLVEYNVVFFREGVQEICDVEEEARRRT